MLLLHYYQYGLDPEKYIQQKFGGVCFYGEDDEDADFGSPDDAVDDQGEADAGDGSGSSGSSDDDWDFNEEATEALNKDEEELSEADPGEFGFGEGASTGINAGFGSFGLGPDFDFSSDSFDFSFGEFSIADFLQGAAIALGAIAFGPVGALAVSVLSDFARGRDFSTIAARGLGAFTGIHGAASLAEKSGLGRAISDFTPDSIQGAINSLSSRAGDFFSPVGDVFDNIDDQVNSQLGSLEDSINDVFGGGFGTVDATPEALGAEFDSEGDAPDPLGEAKQTRLELLNSLLAQVRGDAINPGISAQEFQDIIRGGVLGVNFALPANIETQEGVDPLQNIFDTFGDSSTLAQQFLDIESSRRGNEFADSNNQFFQDLLNEDFDREQSIDNVIAGLKAPFANDVATQQARGNLNAFGGKTANQFILDQEQRARAFGSEFDGSDLFSNSLQDIESRADEAARGFQLGQPDFDFTPFEQEATSARDFRPSQFEDSFRTAVEGQGFFQPGGVSAGASQQGLVPGGSGNSRGGVSPVVGALTGDERGLNEQNRFRSNNRGRGNTGSGAF